MYCFLSNLFSNTAFKYHLLFNYSLGMGNGPNFDNVCQQLMDSKPFSSSGDFLTILSFENATTSNCEQTNFR